MLFEYQISDEGEEFQVALFLDGVQVGNMLFDDDGFGSGFDIARAMGELWRQFPSATVSSLKPA
jgi:hypothetical protein